MTKNNKLSKRQKERNAIAAVFQVILDHFRSDAYDEMVPYICSNINCFEISGKISPFHARMARNIIESRICPSSTLERWVARNVFNCDKEFHKIATPIVMKEYRMRWLGSLITEFRKS